MVSPRGWALWVGLHVLRMRVTCSLNSLVPTSLIHPSRFGCDYRTCAADHWNYSCTCCVGMSQTFFSLVQGWYASSFKLKTCQRLRTCPQPSDLGQLGWLKSKLGQLGNDLDWNSTPAKSKFGQLGKPCQNLQYLPESIRCQLQWRDTY